MNPDNERDDLWELLGRVRQHSPGPFFSRNVLRQIRAGRDQKRTPMNWFVRQWRLATLGAIAATLTATFLIAPRPDDNRTVVPSVEMAHATPDSADYELIAHLDELLAYENNALWLATSPE
jgi:hypothetical protein